MKTYLGESEACCIHSRCFQASDITVTWETFIDIHKETFDLSIGEILGHTVADFE